MIAPTHPMITMWGKLSFYHNLKTCNVFKRVKVSLVNMPINANNLNVFWLLYLFSFELKKFTIYFTLKPKIQYI